jgi:hypothetical protein
MLTLILATCGFGTKGPGLPATGPPIRTSMALCESADYPPQLTTRILVER